MRPQTEQFLRRFALQYPIIQAPMAGASTVELAATITKLGGLGSLPLGSLSNSHLKIQQQVKSFRDIVGGRDRTVNVNFFNHEEAKRDQEKDTKWLEKYRSYYEQGGIPWADDTTKEMQLLYPSFSEITDPAHSTITKLIELEPRIVSFHFGIPSLNIIKTLQDAGISIFISATNLEEFKKCQEAGADAVILQGWEAGGHRGNFIANDPDDLQLSTQDLVKSVIDYIDSSSIETPPFLIPAGGIHSSSQIQEYLDQGVAAVQLGTVWLPSSQCTISPQHFDYIQHPDKRTTIMSPAISGRNLRTIETQFLKELTNSRIEEIPAYPLPYDAFKNLAKVSKEAGKGEGYAAFLAGAAFNKSWKNSRDTEVIFGDLIRDLKKYNQSEE